MRDRTYSSYICMRLREFVGFGPSSAGVGGSYYEDSAGCEVVGVREPVSDAA